MIEEYDIVIVGGGLVGTTLAYALAERGVNIALLDAKPAPLVSGPQDQRAIALTLASQRIYERLSLWQFMQPSVTSIKTIHVSEAGRFGQSRFNSADYQLDAFGYVVQADVLQNVLDAAILKKRNIQRIQPAEVRQINFVTDGVELTVQISGQEKKLKGGLIVGADGTHSTVRRLLNIQTDRWDYQQSALVAHVALKDSHQHCAYERFKQDSIIAALPYQQNRTVMVWTLPRTQAEVIQTLTPESCLKKLQDEFGYRLGRFEQLLHYEIHPLSGLQAKEQCRQNVVLMGNAVHTLHPIAAQGFNLGMRDVSLFNEIIGQAIKQKEQFNQLEFLEKYEQLRQFDQNFTITATNKLLQIFNSKSLALQFARNLIMNAFEFIPMIKRDFAARAMGLTHSAFREH